MRAMQLHGACACACVLLRDCGPCGRPCSLPAPLNDPSADACARLGLVFCRCAECMDATGWAATACWSVRCLAPQLVRRRRRMSLPSEWTTRHELIRMPVGFGSLKHSAVNDCQCSRFTVYSITGITNLD